MEESAYQDSAKYSINRLIISRLITTILQTGCTVLVHSRRKPFETSWHEEIKKGQSKMVATTATSSHMRNRLDKKISQGMIRRRAVEAGIFRNKISMKSCSESTLNCRSLHLCIKLTHTTLVVWETSSIILTEGL